MSFLIATTFNYIDVWKVQRPEKYLGEIEVWDKAEAALSEALNEFGRPWQVLTFSIYHQLLFGFLMLASKIQ